MIFSPEKLIKDVIGVILDGKHLSAARIENGSVVEIIHRTIDNKETEEVILGEVIEAIKEVLTENISGIGIGVPSLVDVKNGIVLNPSIIPSWRKVHLKEILEEQFNIPVYVNNDANCFVLGEKFFGKAKEFENIAGVITDTGFGVGLIINGKLYSGRNAGAGEFCSIPYRDHDYEYYCCSGYFEEKYGLKHEILLERANSGDKIALAIYEIFGIDLGNAIKAIMFALDPDAIVIGGRLATAYEFFETSMLKTIHTFKHQGTLKEIKIFSSDDPYIPVYGAAALCLE